MDELNKKIPINAMAEFFMLVGSCLQLAGNNNPAAEISLSDAVGTAKEELPCYLAAMIDMHVRDMAAALSVELLGRNPSSLTRLLVVVLTLL